MEVLWFTLRHTLNSGPRPCTYSPTSWNSWLGFAFGVGLGFGFRFGFEFGFGFGFGFGLGLGFGFGFGFGFGLGLGLGLTLTLKVARMTLEPSTSIRSNDEKSARSSSSNSLT